jgi:hypothetical protein
MSKSVVLGRKMNLPISVLFCDPRLQARAAGTDDEHVESICEALPHRQRVPHVKVRAVKEEGSKEPTFFVTDGFHTVRAHQKAGRKFVRAIVQSGNWQDAVLDAAGANKEHLGLRRTNADKRRAVEMMMEAFPTWSNSRIATHVGVSSSLADDVRKQHSNDCQLPELGGCVPSETRREGLDGRVRGSKFDAPRTARVETPAFPAGVDTDDWRMFPLDDFLEADDQTWEVLKQVGIVAAGELFDATEGTDTLGLSRKVLGHLVAQVKRLASPRESVPSHPPSSQPSRPSPQEELPATPAEVYTVWKKWDSALGPVVRGLDRFKKVCPEFSDDECRRARKWLDDLAELVRSWKRYAENGRY